MVASSSATPIACNGGSSTVTVSATGGTAPYTGTGTFSRTAGTYSFTVTDANGCTASTSVTISQPAAITVTATPGVIACNGGTTSVTVSATGGTGAYTGTGVIPTQAAGSHTYTVTDANGCSGSVTITISQPAVLVASANGVISCNNGTATVTVTATGGTPPYTGTGTYPSQGPGPHSYLVTDSRGCTSTATITLANPTPIVVTAVPGSITCFGGTGCFTVSATGGNGGYTGTGLVCGYLAGTYTITVVDIKGCVGSTTGTLTEPTKVIGSITTTPSGCATNNGTATVSASGGVGPYTYSWNTSPVQTGSTATGLGGGTYIVTITDASGCTGMASGFVGASGTTPNPPGAVSGPAGACKNQTGVQYCVAPVTGVTYYLWTVPTTATITSGQGTTCITVSFNNVYAGGFICVTDSNACGRNLTSSCKNVPVLISAPSNPVISGPSFICPNTNATYTATATNATSYNWTTTGGLIISSGQGTSTVVVSAPAGFSYGSVEVTTSNCVGSSNKTTTIVVTGVPSEPQWVQTVSPSHSICAGTTYCGWEIDHNDTVRATSYTIYGPSGSTITSHGNTGNPITTNYRDLCITVPAGFISGNITIIGSGPCGSSSAFVWPIYSTPPTPGAISGPTTLRCSTTGNVYSIAAVPVGSSYIWTVPAGATITSGAGTTSITVSYSSSTASGNICVKAYNSSCGTYSALSCLAVSTDPAQPGAITGPTSVCKSQSGVTYSIASVSGALSYVWSVTGGATIQNGQGTTSIKIKYSTATSTTAVISVSSKNNCGTSIPKTLNVAVNLGCRTSSGDVSADVAPELNAYPNPTSGKLNVSFTASEKEKYTIRVVDLIGSVLISETNTAQEGNNLQELDLSGVAKGMYILSIEREGAEIQTMRIVVE